MPADTSLPELQARLAGARLAVSDWRACSSPEELDRWRNAQQQLIEAAKAVGHAEALAASSRTGETWPEKLVRDGVAWPTDYSAPLAPPTPPPAPTHWQQVRELIDKWREPEFWKERGNWMDSFDCARELEAVLPPQGAPTP